MSKSRYCGRHREPRQSRLSPQLLGTGLALPATATLAVVTLSSGSTPISLTSGTTTEVPVVAAPAAAAPDETTLRDDTTPDRASRDTERRLLTGSVVAVENDRRASAEAALSALQAGEVVEVKTVEPPADDTPVPAPPSVGPRAWVKPINASYALTSGYGPRWGSLHLAQDLAVSTGTPVKSLSSGTVKAAGWLGTYGNRVEIEYWDGTVSIMAHLSRVNVKPGQKLVPGQVIGLSGNTGNSTGPHLHLEIIPKGQGKVPPIAWLAKKGVKL